MVVTSVGPQIKPFAGAPIGADLEIVREPVTVTGLDGRWQIDAHPHALVAHAVRRQADADAAAANRVDVDNGDPSRQPSSQPATATAPIIVIPNSCRNPSSPRTFIP